jgi:V8-like Glu-specific endopeptidase
MKLFFYNALCAFILITGNSFAQTTAQTEEFKKSIVKLEGIQMRYSFDEISSNLLKRIEGIANITQRETADIREEYALAKDTIRGTAVLIADGNKMYMVTAKHLVVSKEPVFGKQNLNELIVGKVNINGRISNDINFMGLTAYVAKVPPFAFSSDADDVAVISFAQKDYVNYADYLKGIGCVPIPLSAIATTDEVGNGDELTVVGYPAPSFTDRSTGTSTGKARTNNQTPSSFTANISVTPGYSGGPVFKSGKLAGIVGYPEDIKSNADVSKKPYAKASSAKVIKSSVILSVLRELQGKEGR